MDTINELNSHPCRVCVQKAGKSKSITPVGLVRDHFQNYLKLLKFESMRDREIVTLRLSGVRSIIASSIQTMESFGKVEVLKSGILAWQELEA